MRDFRSMVYAPETLDEFRYEMLHSVSQGEVDIIARFTPADYPIVLILKGSQRLAGGLSIANTTGIGSLFPRRP